LGCNFKDNFEGEHQEVEFSKGALDIHIKDEKMHPASAACLWLVKENFEFFRDVLK
jgi:hypothetical protein